MRNVYARLFSLHGLYLWPTILIWIFLFGVAIYSTGELVKAPLEKSDLTVMHGVLLTEPKITPPRASGTKGGKKSGSISFLLTGYNQIRFSTQGDDAYEATLKGHLSEYLHRQDSVQLLIKKEVYQKKILQQKSAGWIPSFLYGDGIQVFGIADKNRAYLKFDDLKEDSKFDTIFMLILVITGILFLTRFLKEQFPVRVTLETPPYRSDHG